MTPTRERANGGAQLDTGTGSTPATRPNIWTYEGVLDVPAVDTGIGSPIARRPDSIGDAFIPPLWLNA